MKYLLKTKGTDKIPDYLQIRDANFQLIEHCTVKNVIRIFEKHNIILKMDDVSAFIEDMAFGKLTEVQD